MVIAAEAWLERRVSLVALGEQEAQVARYLQARLPLAPRFVHRAVAEAGEIAFERIFDCLAAQFDQYQGFVILAPLGVVVRSLASLVRNKLRDPAVVVVDAGARYAISLLSGHEGGANELARLVADYLDAEPVITTTTEAVKTLIVGIGCRRGTPSQRIVASVHDALSQNGVSLEQVRCLVSAAVKRDERGLSDAALQLGIPLRYVSMDALRRWALTESTVVRAAVDVPAVAEPAALFVGRRARCLMPRRVLHPGVTVAIAEEVLPWLVSVPETEKTEPIELNE
jgi:cobalt-precorrin 5A hydrolase